MKTNVLRKLKSAAQVAREKFDNTARRVAVGSAMAGFTGLAAAADGEVDIGNALLWIAGGVTAGLAVSAAMTSGLIAIRGSKLPRKGS